MYTTRLILSAAAVLSLGGGQLFAQATWDGGNGNWNDANWSGGGAPNRGDNVAIPTGTVNVTSDLISDVGAFNELNISDDGMVDIKLGGRLDFSGRVLNNASLYISGGELQSGNFEHANGAETEAELDISGPSVVDVVGDFDPCWGNPATVSVTGGEADINATGTFWYCSNVTLNANIDSDTFSTIRVGDQLYLGGGTLNISFVDGYLPHTLGQSWIVADGSSRSGTIGNVNVSTPLPKGSALNLSYREGGENGQVVALDLVNTLNLKVNGETGEVMVENPFPGALPLDIDGYIIRSESGSLVEANFGGLGEPGWLPGLDPSQSDGLLSESNLQLSTVVTGNSTFSLGNIYRVEGTKDLAFEFHASGGETMQGTVEYSDAPALQPGDANRDLTFDQLDIIQVLNGAKYLAGQSATWGEGDWDGGPGGTQDFPPAGNGFFDQLDIVAALTAGWYLKGPYAAINSGAEAGDGQTSIGYDASTGEVFVDAPAGMNLTSVNIDSASGIFVNHENAQNLEGSFDTHSETNIFKATFGDSFGDISFGQIATPGLSPDEFVAADLTVIGSLEGGGGLGDVDLIYVPEPSTLILLTVSAICMLGHVRRPQ